MKQVQIPKHVKKFVFDECHKIFLIENAEDRKRMLEEKGWDESDFHPISKIQEKWDMSCVLRAVWYANHEKDNLVDQFEEEDIEFTFE